MPSRSYQTKKLSPLKLSTEEIENPMEAIDNFFSYAHLPQVRELLWEWFKTTVTGDYNKSLSRQERANLVYFYEQLTKLTEAAHLLHNRKK